MSLRAALARATHDVHMRLHGHALSKSLLRGGCAEANRKILGTLRDFNQVIEEARCHHDRWSGLSLAPALAALDRDLEPRCEPATPQLDQLWVESPERCLGALYVAHGAQEGRKIIARALVRQGVQDHMGYWQSAETPDLWETLEHALAQVPESGVSDTIQGAVDAFHTYEARLNAA